MGARNDRERHLYFEMKNWSKVILEQSLVCCFRITSKLNISGALKRHLVLRKVRLVCPEDYYLDMRGKITSSAIYTSISKIPLKTKRWANGDLGMSSVLAVVKANAIYILIISLLAFWAHMYLIFEKYWRF